MLEVVVVERWGRRERVRVVGGVGWLAGVRAALSVA